MNTERPDNDDAADEAAGADEASGTTRDADDTAAGAPEEQETPEQVTPEQVSPEEETEAPEEIEHAEESPAGQESAVGQETGSAAEPQGVQEPEGAAETEAPQENEGAQESEAPQEIESAQESEGVQESPLGHPGRRRSPVIIASVAAAVLLVGGGGAFLATNASSGSGGRTGSGAPGGDGTPSPLALDGYSAGGTSGIAPGEPDPNGVTYEAAGTLADGPGSAAVYWAKGEVSKDEVVRLAEALGVDGTPAVQGEVWRIGGKDGSGPSLQVNTKAPGAWTFSRYAPGTDDCQSTTVCANDPASPAVDPVSVAAAEKAAAPVLKAVGQDDAKLDASQVMGAQRVVNAAPVVGGLPTYGWSTGISVGAQGEVVSGNGQLKAPVEGDTYPVLNAKKTLDLLNANVGGSGQGTPEPRMGIGGCASPVPLKDRLEAPCGSSTTVPEQQSVTVEKAVFGLASHTVEARQTLVPSWLFEVRAEGAEDSFTVTYPAIEPEYLVSSTPSAGTTTGQPSPAPTGPSDEPTSAPTTRDVKVEGYSADGQELTVSFTGGVCADYEASASETPDTVTVTVTETPWPDKVCILIAKTYHQTVQLDEALGDRQVVGSDGEGISKGTATPLPENSVAR